MSLNSLIPTLPRGFDAWEAVITVAIIGILKLYRARLMKRRSVYVDRFGWSIIGYDIVFGIAAILGLVLALYPELNPHIWITRASTSAVLFTAAWQLFEVHAAADERVDAAVAGTTSGKFEPPKWTGDDRRGILRRKDDKRAYDALRKIEET